MPHWMDLSDTRNNSIEPADDALQLVCVLGRSGAGHSTALRYLDDAGFSAVDNVPLALVDQLISLMVETQGRRLAIGIDLRTPGFDADGIDRLAQNMQSRFGQAAQIIYVVASDAELFNRYKATRRRHPLMDEQGSLEAAIAADNQFHHQLTQKADIVIDSTGKSPHIFCQELGARLELTLRTSLMLSVQSFSYKNGLPPAADMVFDMRFLQNPHWHTDLRQLTGREDAVQEFVYADPAFLPCMQRLTQQIEAQIPLFQQQGRYQITVAFGCTGGQHRSVAAACWFHKWAEERDIETLLTHREIR